MFLNLSQVKQNKRLNIKYLHFSLIIVEISKTLRTACLFRNEVLAVKCNSSKLVINHI